MPKLKLKFERNTRLAAAASSLTWQSCSLQLGSDACRQPRAARSFAAVMNQRQNLVLTRPAACCGPATRSTPPRGHTLQMLAQRTHPARALNGSLDAPRLALSMATLRAPRAALAARRGAMRRLATR